MDKGENELRVLGLILRVEFENGKEECKVGKIWEWD